jgi:hypothetical protein
MMQMWMKASSDMVSSSLTSFVVLLLFQNATPVKAGPKWLMNLMYSSEFLGLRFKVRAFCIVRQASSSSSLIQACQRECEQSMQ